MTTTRKISKSKLISIVHKILQEDTIETQEDLCRVLDKQGIEVNQAMVSRLLHKLGAIKMNEGDKIVYRLPHELLTVAPQHSLNQLVLNINHNEYLIVIDTAPGSAGLVARLLDQQKQLDILGTIAGDDTVFVAPQSAKKIKATVQQISKLLLR